MSAAHLPPHDLDAERAILGALIVAPDQSVPLVVDTLTPDHFYTDAHRILYLHSLRLYDGAGGLTLETIQDALHEAGQLSAVGGPAALALAVECGALVIPSVLPTYVEIVKRHAARRDAIAACLTALSDLQGPNGSAPARPVREIVTGLADVLGRVADDVDPDRHGPTDEQLGAIADRVLFTMATTLPEFVTYPLPGLTRIMGGGSKPGELVYLGAAFGTGKTGIALEWASAVAARGQRVLVISAEMTREAVAGRLLTQHAQIPANSFRRGHLDVTRGEVDRAEEAAATFHKMYLVIDDEAATVGAIRRLVRRHRPHFLVIDYLQLLHGPETTEKRHEINAISRALKRLAKRHRCVVMVLSQLTLIPDGKGKFHRPTGASLKESRGPSEDADTILLLWRPDPVKTDLELIVSKGRNHGNGSVHLDFTPTYLQFRERDEL